MDSFWKKLKNDFISGLVLLMPVIFLYIFLKKLFNGLITKVFYFLQSLGMQKLLGALTAPVVTVLAIFLIILIAGMILQLKLMREFRNTLESSLLKHVPGYSIYRYELLSKLDERKEKQLRLVHVDMGHYKQPGLVLSEKPDGQCKVFLPEKPNGESGPVIIIDKKYLIDTGFTQVKLGEMLGS